MPSKARKSSAPVSASLTKRAAPAEKLATARKSGAKALEPVAEPTSTSKQERCLHLLARPDGATLSELVAATGWQPHSVRGFLSGAVKKKLGLTLVSTCDDDGTRRYRTVRANRVL